VPARLSKLHWPKITILVAAAFLQSSLRAADTVKMLKPSEEIRRADFRRLSFSKRPPSAVLVRVTV